MREPGVNIALVQMCSGRDVRQNIATLSDQIRRAADNGAQFILTPEMTNIIESNRAAMFTNTVAQADEPTLAAVQQLAGELKLHVLIGSLAIKLAPDKLANRSFLIDATGRIVTHYDKIHLFDVQLPNGEHYRESRNYQHGNAAVLADLPFGRVGLTICYDMRFAALYRSLAQAGAHFITVPSAFTRPTGQAHWRTLLRCRAIETGCYILAPAQCGIHQSGRETHGHSLIIDPWGAIVATGDDAPGIIYATCNRQMVNTVRTKISALDHDRSFTLKTCT